MGFRTTGVRLVANLSQYKREMRGGSKATRDLKDDIDDLGASAGQMGDSLSKAAHGSAEDMERMKKQVSDLDKQIFTTKRNLATLAMAYEGGNKGGNDGTLDRIKEQQKALKELTSVRKLLPSPKELQQGGANMGKHIRLGFLNVARPIAVALGAVLTGATAYVLPFVGAALAGAIVGGAGLGGVIGGLLIAAQDPRVAAAGEALADRLNDRLSKAASVFVGPALQGMEIIERAIGRINLEGIFKDSAKFVQPLAQGLAHMIEQLGSGLRALIRNAGPAIDQIAYGLAGIGEALADVFRSLSDNGIDAAVALRQTFSIVAAVIRSVGAAVNGLTEAYGFLVKLGVFGRDAQIAYRALEASTAHATAAAEKYNAEIKKVVKVTDPATGSVRRLGSGTFEAAEGFGTVSKAMSTSAIAAETAQHSQEVLTEQYRLSTNATRGQNSALKELSTSLRSQVDPAFALIKAQQTLKEKQDASSAAIKKHGRNSDEARAATRNLALAALDLQGKAGSLAAGFDGKLTPAMRATFRAGNLTEAQINDIEKEMIEAKKAGDKYAKTYRAYARLEGATVVDDKLDALLIKQRALQSGLTISAAKAAIQKDMDRNRQRAYADGGWTGPGSKHQPAGVVHADEYVINKQSRNSIESKNPGLLDTMNSTGKVPAGYAAGGRVTWNFPVNVRKTKIPSWEEVASKIGPPGGGRTSDWIVRAARALVPGIGVISKDRPGARTLNGSTSYHALGRAVDFVASRLLAQRWNNSYKAQTRELISPWQSLNIHNGRRHSYSGAVYRQHSGGNAHNHIAMARGGVLNEPVYGIGPSGTTYSLAERGPEVVMPMNGSRSGGGGGGGGVVTNVYVQAGYVVGERALEDKIAATVDNLVRKGRV